MRFLSLSRMLVVLALVLPFAFACKGSSPTAPKNFGYVLQGTAVLKNTARIANGLLVTAIDNDTAQSFQAVTTGFGKTPEERWLTEPKSIRVNWATGPGTGVSYQQGEDNAVRITCVDHPEGGEVKLCRYLIEVELTGGVGKAERQ